MKGADGVNVFRISTTAKKNSCFVHKFLYYFLNLHVQIIFFHKNYYLSIGLFLQVTDVYNCDNSSAAAHPDKSSEVHLEEEKLINFCLIDLMKRPHTEWERENKHNSQKN